MGYADRMFEEDLDSLREDNKKLRQDLDSHIKTGADFAGIINEMLGRFHSLSKDDYDHFVKRVEKVLKDKRKFGI